MQYPFGPFSQAAMRQAMRRALFSRNQDTHLEDVLDVLTVDETGQLVLRLDHRMSFARSAPETTPQR